MGNLWGKGGKTNFFSGEKPLTEKRKEYKYGYYEITAQGKYKEEKIPPGQHGGTVVFGGVNPHCPNLPGKCGDFMEILKNAFLVMAAVVNAVVVMAAVHITALGRTAVPVAVMSVGKTDAGYGQRDYRRKQYLFHNSLLLIVVITNPVNLTFIEKNRQQRGA